MAVDYIIDKPCEVKDKFTTDGLISRVKDKSLLMFAIKRFKTEGKTDQEILDSSYKIEKRNLGEGVETRDCKISEGLNVIHELKEVEKFCENCPAGSGQSFGCYQVINYPISGKSERWLMGFLEKVLSSKSRFHALIVDYMKDYKITGDGFGEMRADPNHTFFELEEPIEIMDNNGIRWNSNQIMEILFVGKMPPPHQMLLLYFSGIYDYSLEKGLKVQTFEKSDGDDNSIRQLKDFFNIISIAHKFQFYLLVSS